MTRRRRIAALLLGLLAFVGTARGETAAVEVLSWIERDGSGSELVVTLTPTGGAKLVADPGIVVQPSRGIGGGEQVHADPSIAYFDPPVTLRLPVQAQPGEPVEAVIDYAYCIIAQQCLFGKARIATTAPPG